VQKLLPIVDPQSEVSLLNRSTTMSTSSTMSAMSTSSTHPVLPGVCSNNAYQPRKRIAAGAYGCVFEATCVSQQPQPGQAPHANVAIKFIPFRSKDRNPKYVDQIKREVSIVNQLTHPHVVRIHDYVVYTDFPNEDRTIGAIGLVMDLAKCSLHTYISNCKSSMDEASARWLFQQLMLAVDHCHGKCCPSCCIARCVQTVPPIVMLLAHAGDSSAQAG
jgi:serine/threonine protein kinase